MPEKRYAFTTEEWWDSRSLLQRRLDVLDDLDLPQAYAELWLEDIPEKAAKKITEFWENLREKRRNNRARKNK